MLVVEAPDGERYAITFEHQHTPPGPPPLHCPTCNAITNASELPTPSQMRRFHPKTICRIYRLVSGAKMRDNEPVGVGVARLNPMDRFVKDEGRLTSLRRALQEITPREVGESRDADMLAFRDSFWAVYKAAFPASLLGHQRRVPVAA